RGAEVAGDRLDQVVPLWVDGARVQRVVSAPDAKEAGRLLEGLGAQPRHLEQLPARAESAALVAYPHDRLGKRRPDPRYVRQERDGCGVHLDADAVDAALDDLVQASLELGLVDVVLVLPDADR